MPVTDERTQRLLAARLAREQSAQRLPSLAAGLARQGTLVWSGGRGRIGGASGPAPGPDVQYRAGSITKTFVAVAVLRLRDEGRLDLSDPIGRHLGSAAAGAADLTIGQLMSHTSGLRAETAGPWWERTPGSSLESLAATSLRPDARRARAGRWHHYSNVGYALLGELVARLRGQPWDDVIAAELLAPLGMSRTTARPQPPLRCRAAWIPPAGAPGSPAGPRAPADLVTFQVVGRTRFDVAAYQKACGGPAGGRRDQPLAVGDRADPAAHRRRAGFKDTVQANPGYLTAPGSPRRPRARRPVISARRA